MGNRTMKVGDNAAMPVYHRVWQLLSCKCKCVVLQTAVKKNHQDENGEKMSHSKKKSNEQFNRFPEKESLVGNQHEGRQEETENKDEAESMRYEDAGDRKSVV